MVATASDMVGGIAVVQVFSGTTIPTSTTLNVVDGNTHSKNVIDWSVNGGQTILSFDMDHKRNGSVSSLGQTDVTPLTFTANANEPFELSGYYNVTDIGASGSGVGMFAQLVDETAGTAPFSNTQNSRNTINEQFVLGETGGDDFNFLVGSLTGNLVAGHVYIFHFGYNIGSTPFENSGASALGNLTLKIGTVPEPSSILICLAGIFATLICRNRFRS
jgi:hypothetical protein